jgi:transposase
VEIVPRSPDDVSRLQRLVRTERRAKPRDRWRVVLLALQGFSAPQIAAKLDRSRRFVQVWVYRYRDQGIDGLHERPRPGQPTKLPRSAEAALKARIQAGPLPEDGVCALRGRDVVRILREHFGVKYSLQGAYDLLHRLGFSSLRPRPRHRKNDPAAMVQWEQDAPFLSRKSRNPTRIGGSKSGSRTKAASDNKEH